MADSENFTPVEADNKYGQLETDLVNLLKAYEFAYFREDKPIPFCGLQIYPVKVRDYEDFASCCSCLTLNKNEDPTGISMSHLDYLVTRTLIKEKDEGRKWSYKMQRLFEMIFHIQNGLKCKGEVPITNDQGELEMDEEGKIKTKHVECNHIIKYSDKEFLLFVEQMNNFITHPEQADTTPPKLKCPCCGGTEFIEMIKAVPDPKTKKYSLLVDGHSITKQDFVKLRQIVLYQNYPDYVDDSWIDPEIKKDHDEKMRLQQQNNDLHATIEKKVVCLSIATHYKFDEIFDMSIRKFTMALTAVDDLINYQIMKQATMSGFVSLPKGQKVEHWIYKPEKDMYGDSYKSTEDIQNSVSNL